MNNSLIINENKYATLSFQIVMADWTVVVLFLDNTFSHSV